MNLLTLAAGVLALLGSALIGGVFFAFSSFIMKALARVPSSEGIAVMQSINVVVINPSFIGAFMGTALLSVAVSVLVLMNGINLATMFFIGGAVFYFVGTFLVTMFGNVPLNNQLAAVSATDPDAIELWAHYLERWTMLNHIRTVAAIVASSLFAVGFMVLGAAAGAPV